VDAPTPIFLERVRFAPTGTFPTPTKWSPPLDTHVVSLNTLLPPKVMPVSSLAHFTKVNMSILAAMVDLTPTLQDPSSTAARGTNTSRERNHWAQHLLTYLAI